MLLQEKKKDKGELSKYSGMQLRNLELGELCYLHMGEKEVHLYSF